MPFLPNNETDEPIPQKTSNAEYGARINFNLYTPTTASSISTKLSPHRYIYETTNHINYKDRINRLKSQYHRSLKSYQMDHDPDGHVIAPGATTVNGKRLGLIDSFAVVQGGVCRGQTLMGVTNSNSISEARIDSYRTGVLDDDNISKKDSFRISSRQNSSRRSSSGISLQSRSTRHLSSIPSTSRQSYCDCESRSTCPSDYSSMTCSTCRKRIDEDRLSETSSIYSRRSRRHSGRTHLTTRRSQSVLSDRKSLISSHISSGLVNSIRELVQEELDKRLK